MTIFCTKYILIAFVQLGGGFELPRKPIRPKLSTLQAASYFSNRGNSGNSDAASEPQYNVGALSKANIPSSKNVWREESTTLIQGNTLKTWPLTTSMVDMVQISMATEGRPLNANVELWQGPDYTPMSMKIYIEDGNLRPLNAVIFTPQASNTIAVYNTGNMEFPFFASVDEEIDPNLAAAAGNPFDWASPQNIQGGALTTYPFDPAVQSVQVMLNTDGRNLKARIELIQGPNNDKQILEFYASDGMTSPIYLVLETPGTGNVVRLINRNPVEFPFTAFVGPYELDGRVAE